MITNITDTNGDYSNVILHGTGEPGATVTLLSREGSTTGGNDTGSWTYTAVETSTPIVVDANGNWTVDISNLPNTPIDDNEFFKATQIDASGNVSADSDSVHYWHGDWSSVATEANDDYVMMGSGKDQIIISSNDTNDHFVVDGGDNIDTAVFSGKFSDYALSTSSTGSLIVTEGVSTDSNGNGVGDVDELRNIEKVKFTDGTYDVPTGVFKLNGISVDIEHDTGTSSTDRITNDSTLKVTGLVSGATIEYSSDGGQTWTTQYNPQEGVNNISVRQVDAEGHTSDSSNVSFTLDTQAGANIDVDILTGDGYLTAAEAFPGVKVPVTGYVQGDAQPGDTISIILDGNVIGTGTVSSDVNSSGAYTFSVDVLGSDLADGSGMIPELKATVTGSDVAGNTFSAESTEVYMKDFIATVSINVTDGNTSDSDNVISASEASSTVVSGNVEVGGQVSSITISDGTNTLTIPANQITVYSNGYYTVNTDVSSLNDGVLTVSVEASDKLGNVGTNSTTIEKDTQAQAGTVTVDSITDDNIVNTMESGQTIAVTGTATGGDISSGDTLTMTINGKDYSTTVNSDGNWSVDVAGSDLAADADKGFTASVASSDAAGNTVTSSAAHSYTVDSQPEGHDETQTMDFESATVSQKTTNVVITLDISGSMDSDSRLALAKSALEKMINAYDNQGNVNVKLVAFNGGATLEQHDGSVWLKADEAISIIKDLQAGGSTNYEDAVLKTYSNYSEPTADKTVAYFISDGEPTTENYGGNGSGTAGGFLDNDYEHGWDNFVSQYVDDLHVVALGDDALNSKYLDVLASAGNNVSTVTEVSDASQLSDAIVPTNTELSVTGTVSDNVTGGDGAITIQSITVDGTAYTSSTFPSEGVAINGKGTLAFDFSTGNYTYSAGSNEFTKDVTQMFTVTAADADGDTADVKVSINVNVDDTASNATLSMSIGDAEVTTTHNYTYDSDDARNANHDNYHSLHDALEGQNGCNHSNGTLVYKNVNETSWNLSDSSDKLFAITGNSHNANINLSGGNNTLIFEKDPGSNIAVNFGSGKDVLILPGSESDYNLSAFHNNGGVLSGQITGHDNMNLTVNNLDCLVFSDQVMGDSSLYKGETSNHYTYDLSASASLTDTDGSESLSDITISGLPDDGSVTVTGTDVSKNDDGTYNVKLQDDGKIADDVKISSSKELTSSELNDVHASVTSTESNGNETATTEVNESGDNFLYADTGDDLFVGTNQSDTIKVDGDGSTTVQNFDVQNDVLDLSDVIADDQVVTQDTLSQYLTVTQTDKGTEVTVDSNGKDVAGGEVANIMLEGLNDSNNLQIQIDDNKVDYHD
ncbi:Ig-like domain-containing protein [Hydrogenovibrio marinus]|uniref:VWFA domain-containing protein n=1 Tax=Hydrogenovibrio marinus TaxID=28885 RepID=A0A067A0V2_HYDMR|nr:Ig-like domain-containing protein [Hydrogenovibrio marinus]KDN96000.1 hypothetical protein EI16_06855 [Hydrogenovibrio marinus]